MPAKIVLKPGEKYGRLTVLSDKRDSSRRVKCQCSCGKFTKVSFSNLRTGVTKSCGCLRREYVANKNKTHGLTGSPEYKHWKAMHQRCSSGKYVKLGIRVSKRWNDFKLFLKDIGKRPSAKHSLDRYPNRNGHYTLGNVRWATAKEQCRNKDNTRTVRIDGGSVPMILLAERFGIPTQTIERRINSGMSAVRAVHQPPRKNRYTCSPR